MKLSFESGECQCASSRETSAAPAGRCRSRDARGKNGLADERRRRDSARKEFQAVNVRESPMDFNMSDRQREWLNRVQSFMHKHVRPAVPIYRQQDVACARW
jgi:hypothetical protein